MDMDREEACAAISVPESLSAPLVGYEWERDNVGESGGAVYRHLATRRSQLFKGVMSVLTSL